MLKSVNKDKVEMILIWCEYMFGKSKEKGRFPKLRVYKTKGCSYDNDPDGRYGHYTGYNNTISIFLGTHNNYKELCRTVIHEYKHYLLGDKKFNKITKRLRKKGYSDYDISFCHPHEKKAENFEDIWTDICYSELKNKLYRKI